MPTGGHATKNNEHHKPGDESYQESYIAQARKICRLCAKARRSITTFCDDAGLIRRLR